MVSKFPSEEKYKSVDQLIRSTRTCPANIAEGYGRHHLKENIQFCRIASGRLSEAQDHLTVAFECKYIFDTKKMEVQSNIETTIKMLNGYIKYLKKRKCAFT